MAIVQSDGAANSAHCEPTQLTFDMRMRTAVHEASHAIAARAYGLPIDFAEVCADDSGEWVGAVVSPVRERGWARTVELLAGRQGELAFYSDEAGTTDDFERAEQSARKLDPDYSDVVIQMARAAAAKIVRDNRTVISTLAAVLERKGKLSGAEIDGVIGGINGKVRPGPAAPDMTPIGRARWDAARRRARRDYEGAAFIEKWIRQQERER